MRRFITTVEEDNIFLQITEEKPITKVNIDIKNPLVGWVRANGAAKCCPEDEFNSAFGQELATARALARVHSKIAKKLVRSTNHE